MTVKSTGVGSNSETGIGALIPWADRLWAIGYVAHIRGKGIGLYEIDENLEFRLHPESVTGTYANRLVHWPSEQVFIGPHAIDAQGAVRTIPELVGHRLTATAHHLEDPEKVYFVTMEGELFETHVRSLATRHLFDLNKELQFPEGAYKHYKGGHSAHGRLVVANNTYEEPEFKRQRTAGRLAQWDGRGDWEILEENPFVEVSGKQNPSVGSYYGNSLYAVGWDPSSVILRVLHGGKWMRYRLPFGGHSWCHTWNTEWMRIREAQTERYLMDAFGLFYDLPPLVYDGAVWGIRPISSHLRICPDFCSWWGMLVLAGDQTDNAVGQPQSGLWFGGIDELSQFGKPQGWGGPWREEFVLGDHPSAPFLCFGFEHKTLHISHDQDRPVTFRLEVDFLGNGRWHTLEDIEVGSGGYAYRVLPTGFGAHWTRLTASMSCSASAQWLYL